MSRSDTQLNSLTLHFLVTAAELLLWYITGQWQAEYEPAVCPGVYPGVSHQDEKAAAEECMRNTEVSCRHFKVFRELMVKTLDLVCNSREEICMIMTLIWNVNTLQNHFADLKHSVNVGDVISVSSSEFSIYTQPYGACKKLVNPAVTSAGP